MSYLFKACLWAITLLLCACGRDAYGPGAGASTLDRILERGVLVIGTEPEFPPFEYVDPSGEYLGFDMDLARALAADLGVELRIESMAFQSLPTALSNGQIDLILSGLTATAERAKTLLFTEPYFRTGLCLLVQREGGVEGPEDLNAPGRKIAVKLGTTGEIVAARLFPKAELVRFDTEGSCSLEVVNRRADAFIYDQLSIMRHHKNNPETTRALLEPLTYEPYAIAIQQGDFVLWRYLNLFFDRIRGDGRFDELYQKHFSELTDGAQ